MQPLAQPPRKDDSRFDDWMYRLWRRIAGAASIAWSVIDKTGSSLADLTTRNASDLNVLNAQNSDWKTAQDIFNVELSTGIMGTGNLVTDHLNGTCDVAAADVYLRPTNTDTAALTAYKLAAANLTLTDGANNYIYAQYNAGAPNYVSTTVERTDTNTNVLVAKVYRSGTTLHINNYAIVRSNDNMRRVALRFVQTEPIAWASGGMLSGVGARNIAITAGSFWECTNNFVTNAFNSSTGGTFTYAYMNGTGGWIEQAAQTQINNTQYDNGSGILQTLTSSHYAIAWVYMEVDNDVVVLYGQGDYTLAQANSATSPASVPPRISAQGFLVGKIILQKSAATFTSVESAFIESLATTAVNDHEQLAGLLGGAINEHYHLTGSQQIATIDETSTCLVTGCVLSINANPALFDISAGILRFVDAYTNPLVPVYTEVQYPGSTGNSVTNIATQDSTYISIDASSIIYQDASKISGATTRTQVLLGALVHTNRTSITSADSNTEVVHYNLSNSIADVSLAIGAISAGNQYSGNAVNTLRINKTAGTFTQSGINWKNSKQNPNIITAPASTGAAFLATWRNGTGGWTTTVKTDVIPGRYDDGTGGATQPNGLVANNKWTLVKVFYLPNSQLTGIEFGQVVYNSLAEAEASKSDATTDNPALANVPFRGWWAIRGGATDLKLAADAKFIDAGKFGTTTSGAGTGSLVPTMQNSYDNSVQPQIVTKTALGAVQVKRGSAADTDVVFEVLNGAGTPVFQVTGLGVSGIGITLAQARAVATLRV